jgi:acetyltransferase-like isoleucine patch superfamily enzyme
MKIHNLADVQTDNIGNNTYVWQFTVILKNATIGDNCNINCNCFVENDVKIGNNVTVKSGVQIWDGVTLEDNVFIGPNATFTNDLIPRSKQYPKEFAKTLVKQGASIGANATVIAGNTIGAYAMVGAGSVITKDVPAFTVWYGNPAKHKGYITQEGVLLDNEMKDGAGNMYEYINNQLIKR